MPTSWTPLDGRKLHYPTLLWIPQEMKSSEKKNRVKQKSIKAQQSRVHISFFQTHQPGMYVRKDTCPDKILLARSKLCNS